MALSRTCVLLIAVGTLVVSACSSDPEPTPPATAQPTFVPSATETAIPPASPIPAPSPSPVATPEPDAEPTPTPAQSGVLFDYLYAVRLLVAAQWEDAIPAFGLVIRRLPEYARAYHGRGLAYYHEKQTAMALEDFDKAIELKPDLAQAYKDRGTLHRDEGRTEEAISDLQRALDLYERRGDLLRAVEVAQTLNQLR